mmetsp:Transcript_6647/g.14502  ORF Transcript_6647/g.14502 Transcript_6647/m.14502 type:complete len:448 (-) Transcript_6647:37-1380(-)
MVELRANHAGYPSLRRSASTHGVARVSEEKAPKPPPSPPGVSAACLLSFLAEEASKCRPLPAQPQSSKILQQMRQGSSFAVAEEPKFDEVLTTRAVAFELKRRQQQPDRPGSDSTCSYADSLTGEEHWITGGSLVAPASIHVAHAWDASFNDLVQCLAKDCGGNLDRTYSVDVFTTALAASLDDPVGSVRDSVFGADEVLLVLDSEGLALKRLFVLFEVLLAHACGKLRLTCSAPNGWGSTEDSLRMWEARIDAIDWVLAETTRKSDDRRVRAASERLWEKVGKDVDKLLVTLRKELRQEVYSQILLECVEAGKPKVVKLALEMGANPERCDACGNMPEDLAVYNGRTDIEEMIFSWRMRNMSHKPLRLLLDPHELGRPHLDMAPFLTEPLLEEDEEDEPFPDWFALGLGEHIAAAAERSTPSTLTPGLSGASSSRSSSAMPPLAAF